MEALIEDNAFNCPLSQQVRLDRLASMSDSTSHPFHGLHSHQANIILRKDETKSEIANYYHAACGSPVLSTFLTAT